MQLWVSPQCSGRAQEKQPGFGRVPLALLVCEEPMRSPCCSVEGRGGALGPSGRQVWVPMCLAVWQRRAGSSADLPRGQLHKLPPWFPGSVMQAPGSGERQA